MVFSTLLVIIQFYRCRSGCHSFLRCCSSRLSLRQILFLLLLPFQDAEVVPHSLECPWWFLAHEASSQPMLLVIASLLQTRAEYLSCVSNCCTVPTSRHALGSPSIWPRIHNRWDLLKAEVAVEVFVSLVVLSYVESIDNPIYFLLRILFLHLLYRFRHFHLSSLSQTLQCLASRGAKRVHRGENKENESKHDTIVRR